MRGLTLIETVIYLALVSVLMTASIEAFASIDGSASRQDAAAEAVDEGTFAALKISYAIRHHEASWVVFDSSEHRLLMKEGKEVIPLTSANVSVTAYAVTVMRDAAGNGIGESAAFTLDGVEFSARDYFDP